jgi:hypothetical protein
VLKRARDRDNIPIGKQKHNPVLDTRQYESEFPGGSNGIYTANTIAEPQYQLADTEGLNHSLFRGIVSYRETGKSGKGKGMFTAGWELCVQ